MARSHELNVTPMSIREAWLGYAAAVLPPNPSAVQIQECRRAFYGGFYQAICLFIDVPDDESDAHMEARLVALMTEARQFKDGVGTPREGQL